MDENNDIISELLKAQNEIIFGVYKVQYLDNNMKKYCLLNSDWIEKNMDSLTNQNSYLYDDKCLPKEEKRDYSFIDGYSDISLPVNFTFVTEDFMSLLSEKFFDENIKCKIKYYHVEIIIGEECIIMMDRQQRYQYSYIILYDPKKENINKNIDYILKIQDKLELHEARDFILKNNIWNYMKKINFSYEDEYKVILNKNNEKIGYLARNNYLNNNLKLIEKQRLGTLDNGNNFINGMNNIKNIYNNIYNFNMINNNNMNNFMKQMINMNNMNNTNYMGNLNYMNYMINNNNMNNSTNSNNNINNNPNTNYNNSMNSNINYNNMMNGNMNLTNNNNMNNSNMNNNNMNNNIMNFNNMNNNIMNCNNMNNNNMNNSNMNNSNMNHSHMNNSNMNSNIMMNFNMNNANNNNIMKIMNEMNNMNNSNMNSNNMNLTSINNNVNGQINSNMN